MSAREAASEATSTDVAVKDEVIERKASNGNPPTKSRKGTREPRNPAVPMLPPIKDDLLREVYLHGSVFEKSNQNSFERSRQDLFPDNGRLQKLGYAVVDLCATMLIETKYPYLHVGPAEVLRSNLSRLSFLAQLATTYRMHERLAVAPSAQYLKKDPAVQSDLFAAYVAGVFLHSGLNVTLLWLTELFTPPVEEHYNLLREDFHKQKKAAPDASVSPAAASPAALDDPESASLSPPPPETDSEALPAASPVSGKMPSEPPVLPSKKVSESGELPQALPQEAAPSTTLFEPVASSEVPLTETTQSEHAATSSTNGTSKLDVPSASTPSPGLDPAFQASSESKSSADSPPVNLLTPESTTDAASTPPASGETKSSPLAPADAEHMALKPTAQDGGRADNYDKLNAWLKERGKSMTWTSRLGTSGKWSGLWLVSGVVVEGGTSTRIAFGTSEDKAEAESRATSDALRRLQLRERRAETARMPVSSLATRLAQARAERPMPSASEEPKSLPADESNPPVDADLPAEPTLSSDSTTAPQLTPTIQPAAALSGHVHNRVPPVTNGSAIGYWGMLRRMILR